MIYLRIASYLIKRFFKNLKWEEVVELAAAVQPYRLSPGSQDF